MTKATDCVWRNDDRIEYNHNSNAVTNFSNVASGLPAVDYKRFNNKTVDNLKERLRSIYGVERTVPVCLCSSAMGALSALAVKNNKKNFLVYGGTYFETRSVLNAVAHNMFIDVAGPYDYVVCEPLSNPFLVKTDIHEVVERAHSVGAKVVVDNSMLSCYNYNPFDDGADIVIESLSKYADGHGDVIGGVIIGEDVSNQICTFGMFMQPHEAYLTMRGLSTLPIRLERQAQNARKVGEYLRSLTPHVVSDDRIGVITCTFENRELHNALACSCRLCSIEDTFGQVNTILTPYSDGFIKHYPTGFEAYKNGIIRISVGLEDPDDIIADIKQAYEKAVKECK